jgi:hypothetical protein
MRRIVKCEGETLDETESPYFTLRVSLTERRTAGRLMFLSSMGLAESTGPKKMARQT